MQTWWLSKCVISWWWCGKWCEALKARCAAQTQIKQGKRWTRPQFPEEANQADKSSALWYISLYFPPLLQQKVWSVATLFVLHLWAKTFIWGEKGTLRSKFITLIMISGWELLSVYQSLTYNMHFDIWKGWWKFWHSEHLTAKWSSIPAFVAETWPILTDMKAWKKRIHLLMFPCFFPLSIPDWCIDLLIGKTWTLKLK